jgi:hypothetical protein
MRIGILTMLTNSVNYGGVLQAYALVRAVKNLMGDCEIEQICFERSPESAPGVSKTKKTPNISTLARSLIHKIVYFRQNRNLRRFLATKNKKRDIFKTFVDSYVPHTEKTYDQYSINLLKEDAVIVGSDQVWNFSFADSVYLLDFVSKDQYKMSYAAGMSNKNLGVSQREALRTSLSSFDAISVREESSVPLLSSIIGKGVVWALDPTLLLNEADWEEICAPRQIDCGYVFCYFLGKLGISRTSIRTFAKKRGLKIVTMPFSASSACQDGNFGDVRLYDAGPSEFLSCIKYADYIFTDSFHASVFAHLYKKDFFVFDRAGEPGMSDRVYSLVKLFGTEARFCDGKKKNNLRYIEGLSSIDYNKPSAKYINAKSDSLAFLRACLTAACDKNASSLH